MKRKIGIGVLIVLLAINFGCGNIPLLDSDVNVNNNSSTVNNSTTINSNSNNTYGDSGGTTEGSSYTYSDSSNTFESVFAPPKPRDLNPSNVTNEYFRLFKRDLFNEWEVYGEYMDEGDRWFEMSYCMDDYTGYLNNDKGRDAEKVFEKFKAYRKERPSFEDSRVPWKTAMITWRIEMKKYLEWLYKFLQEYPFQFGCRRIEFYMMRDALVEVLEVDPYA